MICIVCLEIVFPKLYEIFAIPQFPQLKVLLKEYFFRHMLFTYIKRFKTSLSELVIERIIELNTLLP